MSAAVTSALDACRTRGIVVEQWAGDEHGNIWRATVLRKHGARGAPMVHLLATTGEEAARMALRYVGARGYAALTLDAFDRLTHADDRARADKRAEVERAARNAL